MVCQQPFRIFPFTPLLLPRHPITQQPAKSRVRPAARLECGILKEATSLFGNPQQWFASNLFAFFLLRPFCFLAILSLNNLPKVGFDRPLSWNVGF
jgi:hypothetical protein